MSTSNTILECPVGSTESWTLTLLDESGSAIDYSASIPTLGLVVWEGAGRSAITFSDSSVAFASAAAGTVDLTIDGSDTASLATGDYRLQLTLTSGGETTRRDIGYLRLTAAPGSDTVSPTPLITLAEFRQRVGQWPATLHTDGTGTDLEYVLSLATDDLHNLIADRYAMSYRGGNGDTSITERSAMMTALATPANLTVTGPMRDYVAHRAMERLLDYAITPGRKDDGGLAEARMRAGQHVRESLRRIVAQVDGYDPVYLGGPLRVVRG